MFKYMSSQITIYSWLVSVFKIYILGLT